MVNRIPKSWEIRDEDAPTRWEGHCSPPAELFVAAPGGVARVAFTIEDAPILMKLEALSEELRELRELVQAKIDPITAEITTLDNYGVRVLAPIKAVIYRACEGSFIATFFEAGITASGPNEIDAFNMLCETLASDFKSFCQNSDRLGRRASRQFEALRRFIEKA